MLPDLEPIVRRNRVVAAILDRAPRLGLPDWYLGAGAVPQTVWNERHGFAPTHGIADDDLVYFDDRNLAETAEDAAAARAEARFADLSIRLDVTNEARVHEWYPFRFGRTIEPYRSRRHAIGTWPTTATSVGVRTHRGRFDVYAPFGLDDLFAQIVRPNRTLVPQSVYGTKTERWRRIWPNLAILPW
jgi:hypothetical protein